jgi:hypothetical protein
MNNHIKELLSPNFHNDIYLAVLVTFTVILFLSYFIRKVNYFYVIMLAVSFISMLVCVKNIPFYGIFATLVLAFQLQNMHFSIINKSKTSAYIDIAFNTIEKIAIQAGKISTLSFKIKDWQISALSIMAVIALSIALYKVPLVQNYYSFSLEYKKIRPYYAYEFVKRYQVPGKFYTYPTWGSYAIRKLYPEYKVFIDTRFDMYGEKFFKESHDIKLTRNKWEEHLNSFKVNWVVIPPGSELAKALSNDENQKWFEAYRDSVAVIYIKNTFENKFWFKESGAQKHYTAARTAR